jgi:hypothetical protein
MNLGKKKNQSARALFKPRSLQCLSHSDERQVCDMTAANPYNSSGLRPTPVKDR